MHVHLIEGHPGCGTDGIIVRKFHVRKMSIPIILSLLDNHSEHLSHGVIHALDVAVAVRMIGACCNFVHAVQLADSVRQLGAEMEAVVGEETNRTSPQRGVLVNHNVGGAFGREFGPRNGVNVRAPAETVGEKENVGILLGRDREGAEVVNADCNARAGRQGQRKYGPRRCLSRRLPRLALEAMSKPPSREAVHADPPKTSLKHGKCANDSKVA